jgi:hypothetical protein
MSGMKLHLCNDSSPRALRATAPGEISSRFMLAHGGSVVKETGKAITAHEQDEDDKACG